MPQQPTNERWVFILNPNSGHVRKDPSIPDRVRTFIREARITAEFVCTERAGHATELARRACERGVTRIVAVGGDGTMNEVARALVNQPSACLGLIPLGSGNGLARELHLPLALEPALAALLRARPVTIDSALANAFPFFCAAGTGLDADIALRFSGRLKRGFSAYVVETLRELRRTKPIRIRLGLAGTAPVERTASLVVVANAAQFGNGARIAPGALLDDGLLDLVAVPPLTAANMVPLSLRLFLGNVLKTQGVLHRRVRTVEIERTPQGPFHTDGEVRTAETALSFSVSPRNLQILTLR